METWHRIKQQKFRVINRVLYLCEIVIFFLLFSVNNDSNQSDENDYDLCGRILIVLSYILVGITAPFAICFCINVCNNDRFLGQILNPIFEFKVVQEYERAVIFRLGRILRGLFATI